MAQLGARLTGGQEAVSSSLATRTKNTCREAASVFLRLFVNSWGKPEKNEVSRQAAANKRQLVGITVFDGKTYAGHGYGSGQSCDSRRRFVSGF